MGPAPQAVYESKAVHSFSVKLGVSATGEVDPCITWRLCPLHNLSPPRRRSPGVT